MTSRTAYLRDDVFPRATADGAFGPDVAYITFAEDDCSAAVDAAGHFLSDLVFGTVTVTGSTGDRGRRDIRVVVKFKNADARLSADLNMHAKFHNECVFYARLLPELARRAPDPDAAFALFPRFVFSNATVDGRDDGGGDRGEQVIVVANATPAGYRAPDSRLFLDGDHVLLALRKLGALHGLSYAAKAHPEGRRTFLALTATLSETEWFAGHWYKSPRFLSGTGNRGVNALLADPKRGHRYAGGRLDGLLSMLDGESDTMAELLRPTEPLAVLCHGDYCRNNLLFRYDAATGRPVDAVIVDPAQARYASPAVDLSFFLFMSTTAADRAARWDEYVDAYLDGVARTAPRASRPTAADVHAEMRGRCLYGYAHCSFFLPAMVDTRPPDMQRLVTCTDDERIEMINGYGGAEADGLLASVVGHMVDRGYV